MNRVSIFGCPVDPVTMADAESRILAAMRSGRKLCHTSLNVAKLIKMRSDALLRDDVMSGDLITADGMGIVLGAKVVGHPVPERVSGIDVMDRTLALCAQHGLRPYILGARQEVLETAIVNLRRRYDGLNPAGWRNGYFDVDEEEDIVKEINASGADCLFVALPTPMKENFLARHHDALKPAFVMGVGGSIDVFAGLVRRAPGWVQRSGFEWLFRLIQEPGRMWKRYLSTNTQFLFWVMAALLFRAVGREYAPLAPGVRPAV